MIPIFVDQYAKIARGFYTVKFDKLGHESWKVLDRQGLQTIRFDRASLKTVDYARSKGVIGQSYLHGSLYVYLDAADKTPIITLNKVTKVSPEILASEPYLQTSRWQVDHLERAESFIAFRTKGFGMSEMKWIVPQNGRYKVSVNNEEKETVDVKNHVLEIDLGPSQNEVFHIKASF